MRIACPACGYPARVTSTWTFTSYIARRCECTSCRYLFETHQTFEGYSAAQLQPHIPQHPAVFEAVMTKEE